MIDQLPHNCHLISLAVRGDDRGRLVSIEGIVDVPFAIARVYYIYYTKEGIARGFHAHRSLRQLAVAVSGSCKIILDDGVKRTTVLLDDPTKGLVLGSMTWREMIEFSKDCVLMVLADAHYNENDYIRDYNQFLLELGER